MKKMRKGISTIIATIMLVVITIGLISTAYLYFAGIVTVGPVLSIASAYCDASTKFIYVTLKNEGTASVTTSSITWLNNGNSVTPVCNPTTLNASATTSCTFTGQTGVNNIMAIGPKNQAGGPVTC